MVQICVSIAAPSMERMESLLSTALAQGADLVEIRFDHLPSLPSREELARRLDVDRPLIATVRKPSDGGLSHFPEAERRDFLARAAERFEYVDVELESGEKSFIEKLASAGCRVIVSFHDFSGMPDLSRLRSIYRRAKGLGADLVKLACMARSKRDVSTLLAIHAYATDIIAIPMGRDGMVGRVLAPLLGSAFTYAYLDGEAPVAPGMLPIGTMRQIYRTLGEALGDLP